MGTRAFIGRAWPPVRTYLVVALLGFAFLSAAAKAVWVPGGPTPQQPPDGYVSENRRVVLQWEPGARPGPIALQVSRDDPDFQHPRVEHPAQDAVIHILDDLAPGHTYYWRLVQDGRASPAAAFRTSTDALRF